MMPLPSGRMPLPADHTNQLTLFHVVGFSGHRQLANPAGVAQVIQDTLVALSQKSTGEWVALSSVAVGGDQVFAIGATAGSPKCFPIMIFQHQTEQSALGESQG